MLSLFSNPCLKIIDCDFVACQKLPHSRGKAYFNWFPSPDSDSEYDADEFEMLHLLLGGCGWIEDERISVGASIGHSVWSCHQKFGGSVVKFAHHFPHDFVKNSARVVCAFADKCHLKSKQIFSTQVPL